MRLRFIDKGVIGQARGNVGVFDVDHIKRLAHKIRFGKYTPPILFKEGATYTPITGFDIIVASSSVAKLTCAVSDDFEKIRAIKVFVEKITSTQCPIEKAEFYSLLTQTFKMSTLVSAALAGETKEYAYRLKALLSLPVHTKELVKRSLISISKAQLLLRFDGDIDALADRIVIDNLTILELRRLILPKVESEVDRVGRLLSDQSGFNVKVLKRKDGSHSVLLDHLDKAGMKWIVNALSSVDKDLVIEEQPSTEVSQKERASVEFVSIGLTRRIENG